MLYILRSACNKFTGKKMQFQHFPSVGSVNRAVSRSLSSVLWAYKNQGCSLLSSLFCCLLTLFLPPFSRSVTRSESLLAFSPTLTAATAAGPLGVPPLGYSPSLNRSASFNQSTPKATPRYCTPLRCKSRLFFSCNCFRREKSIHTLT